MNALLINPAFPDTFWSYKYALKFIRKKAVLPPLGLVTLAAMLPAEWEIRLVDMNVTKLTDKDLAWADIAFITSMAVQRDTCRKVIHRCKQAGLRVVAGGPLFTNEFEQFGEVDHFVLNEAEITLPPFLKDLAKGCLKRIYRTDEFCDIRKTPVPRWDLIDTKRYASMSIQFSRGCPFRCDFCNVTSLLGYRPRVKTTEQIIAELDAIYDMGWRNQVFFVDDNFIANKKYLKTKLLPAIIEWQRDKKGLPLYTEASINLADDEELMKLMVEAGFDMVFIGIETPDEKSLAECDKKQNINRDLIQSIQKIQKTGLQVQGGFIVGFDSDTHSIFDKQIEFIQKSSIVTAMVGLLNAPRGTRLYERLMREGRIVGEITGDNVDGTTNIIPKMGMDTLLEGYKYILMHIYSPKYYYNRVISFLKDFKAPKFAPSLDFQRILAFFRSCIYLGIIGKERFQYWKLLFWTVFRRPRLFPLAVTFAIYGYHFRKIYEVHILRNYFM
ncbi:MAG: B12-binding domain-containing radical SAM protein [Deltaproteobacteria bacterium]|nr:B12-binding domain-containing radical SAM protein [Deltaproteobacteria bacterium]MBW2153015.1 B12-binding domain-containing radical SAM protein [Deltaproteobacteria bacterium]